MFGILKKQSIRSSGGPGRRESGVTLIELMISILALSIILVATTSIFQWVLRVWVTSGDRIEATQHAVILLSRVSEDIRSALPIGDDMGAFQFYGDDENAPQTGAIAGNDGIRFNGTGFLTNEGTDNSDVVRTQYWMRDNAGVVSLFRNKRNSTTTTDVPTVEPTDIIGNNASFSPIATGLQIQYFSGGSWQNSWNSDASGALPEYVRTTVFVTLDTISETYTLLVRPASRGTNMTLGS